MPYDPNLDQKLFDEIKEFEKTRLTVSVHQYNEGEKKLQMSRENKNAQGDWSFAKLGRLSKDEIESILPFIEKAVKLM